MIEGDWSPLDDDEHTRQLAWLRGHLASLGRRARVLDLFCGDGRAAVPLAREGLDVVAVDRDPEACAAVSRAGVRTACVDLLDPDTDLRFGGEPFDCALCLGNSLMLVADPDAAVALMRRIRLAVRIGGRLIIDDVCTPFWREVAEGNWQEGFSEDGRQLVWGDGDCTVALREDDDADEESWDIREGDRPLRLWSLGSLRLLALASGWEGPARDDQGHVLVFTRPADTP